MSFASDAAYFFDDFAITASIGGNSVKAIMQPYFDERDIERKSLLIPTASAVGITSSMTATIGSDTYHITRIFSDDIDPHITIIILGAKS